MLRCIAVGGALGPSSPVMNEEQFQYSPLPSPSPSPSLAAGASVATPPQSPGPVPSASFESCSNTTGTASIVSSLANDFSATGNCTGNLSSVTGLAYYVLGRQDGDVWCIEHPLAFYSFCFNATDFLSTSNLALCPV